MIKTVHEFFNNFILISDILNVLFGWLLDYQYIVYTDNI